MRTMRPEDTQMKRELLSFVSEVHPHISNKIDHLWGSKECRDEMKHLLTDTRNGQRRGFAPDVAQTIFRLLALHDSVHPEFDDSDEPILPFGGNPKPVPDRVVPDSGYGTILKISAWALVLFVLAGAAKLAYKAGLLG